MRAVRFAPYRSRFRFEADDSLLVAGDDEAIDALESEMEPIPA